MISLAEFRRLSAELQSLGWAADTSIQKHVTAETSKQQAVAYANKVAEEYDDEYDILLSNGTIQVIQNAADHYNNTLHLGIDTNEILTDVQAVMQTEVFFGSTLNRRVLMNKRRLRRQIAQTAAIDPQKLGGLFTNPVPFGAYTNIGRRLLLGTLVNAEHHTAKAVAKEADIPFLRWTLSHKHQQEDECDDLANAVDKSVVAYLDEKHLDIDPKGLYLIEDTPSAPHPNCQCELRMVTEDGEEEGAQPQTRAQKAFHVVKQLLQRLQTK